MKEFELVRQAPLSDQVLDILLDRIKRGYYPPGTQLPPENEMISEFQISKSTLRSAYAKLEERDIIHRRQGIGTFINKHFTIANPLHELIDFEDRIKMQGYKPGFHQLNAKVIPADSEIAECLKINPNRYCLRLEKVWTADEKPIIYTINHIPYQIITPYFSREECVQPGLTEPLFQFFRHCLNTPIDYLTSSMDTKIAKACSLPDEFSVYDPHTPLMMIEDIGYDTDRNPVLHSWEHLFGPACKFETIRRVL